jgi:hypothetical protein
MSEVPSASQATEREVTSGIRVTSICGWRHRTPVSQWLSEIGKGVVLCGNLIVHKLILCVFPFFIVNGGEGGGWSSWVGIVTDYGLDGGGIWVRFPSRGMIIYRFWARIAPRSIMLGGWHYCTGVFPRIFTGHNYWASVCYPGGPHVSGHIITEITSPFFRSNFHNFHNFLWTPDNLSTYTTSLNKQLKEMELPIRFFRFLQTFIRTSLCIFFLFLPLFSLDLYPSN